MVHGGFLVWVYCVLVSDALIALNKKSMLSVAAGVVFCLLVVIIVVAAGLEWNHGVEWSGVDFSRFFQIVGSGGPFWACKNGAGH